MGILEELRARVSLFFMGGEAFLQLTCTSCGYVVQRRIVGHELEEWVRHHVNQSAITCVACGNVSVTTRVMNEKEFRKQYPHYMQGG